MIRMITGSQVASKIQFRFGLFFDSYVSSKAKVLVDTYIYLKPFYYWPLISAQILAFPFFHFKYFGFFSNMKIN